MYDWNNKNNKLVSGATHKITNRIILTINNFCITSHTNNCKSK